MLSIFLAASLVTASNPASYANINGRTEAKAAKICQTVNAQSMEMLSKKYNMCAGDFGFEIDKRIIEKIVFVFVYNHPVADINEARALMINICKDHYANIINSRELRRYLKVPFELHDITMSIKFCEEDFRKIFHPGIGTGHIENGELFIATDFLHDYRKHVAIRERLVDALGMVEGRIPPFTYNDFSTSLPPNFP